MSRVLPKEPSAQVILTATCKWSALAGGMAHYFDETISGERFQEGDVQARSTGDGVWWEEEVHAPYSYDGKEFWSCGGWLMAVPMPLKNIWIVYKL